MPTVTFHDATIWNGNIRQTATFQDGVVVAQSTAGPVNTGTTVINAFTEAQYLGIGGQTSRQLFGNVIGTAVMTTGVADWNRNGVRDVQDPITVQVQGNRGQYAYYYDNTWADGDQPTNQWRAYNPAQPPIYQQPGYYPQQWNNWGPPPPPPPPCPPGQPWWWMHGGVDKASTDDSALAAARTPAAEPEKA